MDKTFIGIDPGKSGAMVSILPDRTISTQTFPFIGDEYDISTMNEMFKEFKEKNAHIGIEDVKALQKPLDRGNWSLSACKHILITLCHVHQIPYTLLYSKTWQKEMFQGIPVHRKPSKPDKNGKMKEGAVETKVMAHLAAVKLFPGVKLTAPTSIRATKPHDGICDALLMAEYCRRHFK